MANLLSGILFCLLVGLSLQDNEEKLKTKRTVPDVLKPKTFNGRRYQSNCTAEAGPPSLVPLSPGLDGRLEDPAAAYTTGHLSTISWPWQWASPPTLSSWPS